MVRRGDVLMCLCLAMACTRASTETPAREHEAVPEDAKASEDGSPVVAKICEHPCAGELASIAVFRDAQGAVGRYRFDGDLEVCSHPPRIYYDERGRNVLGVAHRPVEKDEAEAIAQRQADAVAGFTEAETLRCPTKPAKPDG